MFPQSILFYLNYKSIVLNIQKQMNVGGALIKRLLDKDGIVISESALVNHHTLLVILFYYHLFSICLNSKI